MVIESPNIISLTFREFLPGGKTFFLEISGIKNPDNFGESRLAIYTYEYNSDQVKEFNDKVLELSI